MTTITLPESSALEGMKNQPLTPGQLMWRRFRKHKAALFALGGMIVLLLYIS